MKFLNNFNVMVSMAAILSSGLVYALTTFATVDYVDKRHMEVKESLKEIKDTQKDTQKMVYEMYQFVRRK